MDSLKSIITRKGNVNVSEAVQIFEGVNPYLDKASKYEDIKEVLDLAKACAIYSKLKDGSDQARNLAAKTYLRAERKLGELLSRQIPQNGKANANGKLKLYHEMGISKMRASRSQTLAEIPEDNFEVYLESCDESNAEPSVNGALEFARGLSKMEIHQDATAMQQFRSRAEKDFDRVCQIIDGDFSSITNWDKVHAIVTEAPAHGGILDAFAQHVRKVPIVAIITEQDTIENITAILSEKLEFRWLLAVESEARELKKQKVKTVWRPVALFGKAANWIGSDYLKRDARTEMGLQTVFANVILRLTKANELVCDPFLSGPESCLAALNNSRRFLGMSNHAKVRKQILAEAKECLQEVEV